MPIKDGIEASAEVREFLDSKNVKRECQPKIIGVTGHVQESFKKQGINAGMDAILDKPLYKATLQ
jgi:CheY-like chemotaxis protein